LAGAFQEAGFVAAGGGLLLALHRRAGERQEPEAELEESDAGG
jgi:hypothetical protein